jgi:hypothetical protein
MHIDTARNLIQALGGRGPVVGGGFRKTAGLVITAQQAGVALGLAPGAGPNDRHVAVRIFSAGPNTQPFIHLLGTQVGNEFTVENVGPLSGPRPIPPPPHPIALQGRRRPLKPGLSVAHHQVTAGTIGAFCKRRGSDVVHILSNNHVLANSNSTTTPNSSAVGDSVVQPSPGDGGTSPADEVATLSHFVQLTATSTIDAATAALPNGLEFETSYGGVMLTGDAPVVQGARVWKFGSTTSRTAGVIGATEVNYAGIQYPFGTIFFDGAFEVWGDEVPFSEGGDSGSLVINESNEAVGLLFAGQDPGPTATGYTLVLPIRSVLAALDLTLLLE